VTIRNCDFHNSAYAGGVAIYCRPILRCETTVFNGRVVVENNTFTQAEKRICAIDRCEEVIFRGNRFKQELTLPHKHQHGPTGCSFDQNYNVTIEEMIIEE
jgi:hypothetical protein